MPESTRWADRTNDLRKTLWSEQYNPVTAPASNEELWAQPTVLTEERAPEVPTPVIWKQPTPQEPTAVPFWQRALQAFAAPFQWVDETVIKPGLSLLGTTAGFVEEVARRPGEDFWEWKKRSWAGWKAPGVNINVPWSDDPWRVDMKGVMELAPWLLIPGAGQVGTGVKAARGVAGVLGKFGQVGKALGYAVEYSPWGIVEKTAGVALKGGVKAVGKISGKVSTKAEERLFGKIPEPEPPTIAVGKLTKFFKESVIPARREFKKLVPEQVTAKQATAIEKITARYRRGEIDELQYTNLIENATAGGIKKEFALTPEALIARQEKAIKDIEARVVSGELAAKDGKSLITKIRKNPAYTAVPFSEGEVKELLGVAIKNAETGFVGRDSSLALRDLLMTGELPQPHHIRDFAKVFGDDFAKAVGEFARLPITKKGQILDLLNLPRAVLASGDLSATFRQGLILTLTHPTKVPRAFWNQLKHFASEKLSLEMDDALRTHPLYREAVENGVEFTALRKEARLFAKEEPFASNLAQRIPFVRKSERAFTGFLNEMRMGTYEAAHNAMIAQGATKEQMKLMASFVNIASGRGTLPANLDRYSPVLNTILFSARYQMSTLQLPRQLGRMLLSQNPYMRKEAAKALVTFVGGGAALLALLKNTGAADVEIDPRSGDFGKIQVGETRLDIWRGYLQYARFAAQMLTGERKSAYGNMNKAQRSDIAWRFIQSKASPAAGLMVDMLKGETYMGEDLITSTSDTVRSFRERMLPLAVQDVMDAMEMSGASGLWTAAPAFLGVGVLTYVNDFVKTKQKIAKELGYETWDEIDPTTQRQLENSNPELQAAFIEFDRQVMGTAWGDWRLAGKAIEDTFRGNTEQAVAQYRETGDGVLFRDKISDAWTARRGGYAAREKMPQFEDIVSRMQTPDTAEALVGLGPEQMAIRIYNDALYGKDMYDEFGDYRFDEAEIRKQQLRSQLGNEMFDYVEDYRGVRYEDFPQEFQELSRAKQILRPYWQVKEWAIEMYGEGWADSSRGKSIISRIRKNMRLSNPELNQAYERFYTQ